MTALLDTLLLSSVVLAPALILMPLLRRQSAALRHWILLAALVGAALAPVATVVMPKWDAIAINSLIPETFSRSSLDALRAPSLPPSGPSFASAPARSAPAPGIDVDRLVTRVWLAGTTLSFAFLVIGIWRLQRLAARATVPTAGPWRAAEQHSAVVRVTSTPGRLLVWGLRRPTIIIPRSALTWPSARIDTVVRHELAHVRRHDWLALIIAESIKAIYWINPLVWLACSRLRVECELACDDIVIEAGTPGTDYATHLIDIAQELQTDRWLPAPAAVRASTLERRVRAMLERNRNRRPLSTRARTVAATLVGGATLTVALLAAQSFVSLSGTIVDASNAVLPGVKLMLTNEQTQAKYEIQTDRSGRYEFVGLPPGNYAMEAVLPGFSRFSGRVIVTTQNLQQDLTMSIGMLQETITVRQDAVPAPPDPDAERRVEAVRQKRAAMLAEAAAKCGAQAAAAVRMGGNIRTPVKLKDVRPYYPESLRGSEGVVVLHATVGKTGSIEDVEVMSATHHEFAQSASDAVKQWEFDATLLNCEPIETPMKVTVNYRLQ